MATYKQSIENTINEWYCGIDNSVLSRIYPNESINQELIDLWWDLPLESRIDIYDECES